MDALIGHSGFVGGTLLRQRGFEACFRSTDIERMAGQRFGTIVCAGISAVKWQANREPDADLASIERLWRVVASVACERFVLVSTVDVFANPVGVDESTRPDATEPYGRHRLAFEHQIRRRFEHACIVRLPGLVGTGLKKNALFDLAHRHRLEHLDPRAVFQFYPMANLWTDVSIALSSGLDTVHLTAAPLAVERIAREAFGVALGREAPSTGPAVRYDVRSEHARQFGGAEGYTYSARESLLAIRAYAQAAHQPPLPAR